MEASIRVEGLSKRYRVCDAGPSYATLREALTSLASSFGSRRLSPREQRETWALRDVSFEVKTGEVVGVIGGNGAGKTTLLKLLSRVTRPTSGRAYLRGRVASLLELGAGSHPELTGRENIFLSGAILGMSKAEVKRHFDAIVAFAGLEQSLDIPVKFFSSGMKVRLSFAVAAHLDAEIVLTDEILGVGDAAFQAKSHELMRLAGRESRTVMIVSHNLGAIAELCQRTILLDHGRVVSDGPTATVVKQYLQSTTASGRAALRLEPPRTDKGVAITRAAILDTQGVPSAEINFDERFTVQLEFRVDRFIQQLSIGIRTTNHNGVAVATSWVLFQQPYHPGTYVARGEFPGFLLAPGQYHLDVGAEHYRVEEYHYANGCLSFDILNTSLQFDASDPGWGLVLPRLAWIIEPGEDRALVSAATRLAPDR